MKKNIFCILVALFLTFTGNINPALCKEIVQKGSMVNVYPIKTISTAVSDEGDTVYFINPADVWVNETNVFPKNTYFKGEITMVKMPVKGIHGALKIELHQVIFPNGERKNIRAVLNYQGKEQIGGDLTPPASYNSKIHPIRGSYWNDLGVLQYVPSGDYEMGRHTTISTGERFELVITEDFISN